MISINIVVQEKSRPALGTTHAPIERVPALFPRGKTAVAWGWPVSPSSATDKSEWSYASLYASLASIGTNLNLFFFLFAFAKLRKAAISFGISIRLSAWNKSAPTQRIFIKFDTRGFLEILSRKFKFFKNLARIAGTLPKDRPVFFFIMCRWILLRVGMFPTSVVGKSKQKFYVQFFYF